MRPAVPPEPPRDPQAAFAAHLERAGLKMTAQRGRILEVFLRQAGHVTPEELCALVRRRGRGVGLATVYRTLKLLCGAGLAEQVDFGEGALRYEPRLGRAGHEHLVCEVCGRSVEIMEPAMKTLQEAAARSRGFTLPRRRTSLYGLCPECQAGPGAASDG
jgi:Fur family transcriptional regulator, ferric uptake regulator